MKRFPPFVWMSVVLLVTVLIAVLAVGSTPEQGEVSADVPPVNASTSREKTPPTAPAPSAVAIPAVKVTDSGEKPASGVAGAEIVLPPPPPPPAPEPTPEPANSTQAPEPANSTQAPASQSSSSSSKTNNSTQEAPSSKKQEQKADPAPKPQKSKWDQCIDRVDPGRTVDWRIGNYGHYGQASTNYVLLGNHTPDHRKCAVVYHEWFHTVHARKEGGIGNIINTYGRNRLESITDCGELMLGADWVNYGCGGEADRQKAREILGW